MYSVTTTVLNEEGLHARPASLFIQCAKKYASNITITKGLDSANAKSIVSVLGLAAAKGNEITISAEGDDERPAVEALKKLMDDKFENRGDETNGDIRRNLHG
ncbi:MAG: HPr family phosphocarrier protein [Clostridiales Family XIII bacterium]|nr:HPr family phosphocarrier protein [Clostridiales Family XIII bacterium]